MPHQSPHAAATAPSTTQHHPAAEQHPADAAQPATELPLVSVLMPIRNERDAVADSLQAVLTQDWPADKLEVLVLDGGSSDGTREVVAETAAHCARAGTSVRVLDNPAGYVPHALNLGLAHARGTYIARVDGHCIITPDHIRRCFERMHATGADNVGGLAFAVAQGYVARAIAAGASSPFGVGSARFRHRAPQPGWVDTAFPGFWRRETFTRLGGFDEELIKNQDDEFNLRVQTAGGRIWLEPKLKTLYRSRASFAGLWRQYFEYGLYKVRVAQKCRGFASMRHLAPSAFVLALLGSLLAAVVSGVGWLGLAVAGPYALGCAVASFATAWGARSMALLPALPAVFATLHLSYGAGVLAGLWRFRRHGLPRLRLAKLPPQQT